MPETFAGSRIKGRALSAGTGFRARLAVALALWPAIVAAQDGTITTVAGTGEAGSLGDGHRATQATLGGPRGRQIALADPPALSADATSVPVGAQITFRVGGLPGQRAVIAFSRASSGAGTVQGQTLLLGSDLQVLTTGTVDSTGTFSLRATVSPGTPAGTYYLQAGVADDPALTTNLRLTNGIALTVRQVLVEEGVFAISGTMHYLSVEGGCWQFRSTTGETYELVGDLARSLRVEGRRAEIKIRARPDLASICMVGTIAEVIEITRVF